MDLAWWQVLLGAIVGLLILTILVVVHELGHAIVAKRNGVEVEEFGIGFPPRAKVLGKYKGTIITLNWLPLGGFCKLKGESDDARGNGAYGAAKFWPKTKILLAGVFMNFVTAVVIFTILAFVGIPKITPDQFAISSDNHGDKGKVSVYSVVDNSPAYQAGLRKGDEIVSLSTKGGDNHNITLTSQVSELSKKYAGQEVIINYKRNGIEEAAAAKLNQANSGKGYLGVSTNQDQGATIKATWSAPLVAVINVLQFVWLTITGLAGILISLFQGLIGLIMASPTASSELSSAGEGVSGPIGILGYIFPSALAAGPITLLYISGVVSLSLAVMNLLPIPGLDGGRWFLTALFRLRGKKLSKEKEEKIVGIGMTCLFGLIILVTLLDITKML